MTVKGDVIELLTRVAPEALCDDCIAEKLHLSRRQHANNKTRELQTSPTFTRREGECSSCGSQKLVICCRTK